MTHSFIRIWKTKTIANNRYLSYVGCHVIATARNVEIIKDLGLMGLSILALDVTSKQSIDECKSRVEQLTEGFLDILVNNA